MRNFILKRPTIIIIYCELQMYMYHPSLFLCKYHRLYNYHWVDASAGGLLVLQGIIRRYKDSQNRLRSPMPEGGEP
jgi:hypothetical protein